MGGWLCVRYLMRPSPQDQPIHTFLFNIPVAEEVIKFPIVCVREGNEGIGGDEEEEPFPTKLIALFVPSTFPFVVRMASFVKEDDIPSSAKNT